MFELYLSRLNFEVKVIHLVTGEVRIKQKNPGRIGIKLKKGWIFL